jgi:hypothetical protein
MNAAAPPPVPSQDAQYLKLIEIFHYVMAGLAVAGMAFLFAHYMIMNSVFTNPQILEQMRKQQEQRGQAMPFDPAQFIHAFVWFYALIGAWGLVSLVANLVSGLSIRARRRRMFSLIVAGFNCINFPFGTLLGIFTLILLLRPVMPALYHETPTPAR